MKGIKAYCDKTRKAQEAANGRNIWIPLYYNPDTDTIYSNSGSGRELVTHFINEATPEDIKEIIHKWKWR